MKRQSTDPNELAGEPKGQARECETEGGLADLAEANDMALSLDDLDEAAGGRSPLGMRPCKSLYGSRGPYYVSSRHGDRCIRLDRRVW